MSATKEETPGGQTGGPVRGRQSADNGPVISSIVSDHDAIARYLNAVYGTENEGFAFIGHYAPKGTFKQRAYHWPDAAQELTEQIHALTEDGENVHVCPYLMASKKRLKGNAVSRALVHVDIDSGTVDLGALTALGAYAANSGSPGNAHVYIPLTHSLTQPEHAALCAALCEALSGDTSKTADNDFLRPVGSVNQKPDGGPVTWLIEPEGIDPTDPEHLASQLGIDLEAEAKQVEASGSAQGKNLTHSEIQAFLDQLPNERVDEIVATERDAATNAFGDNNVHGPILGPVHRLVRFGEQGFHGVPQALEAIYAEFRSKRENEDDVVTRREWDRSLSGAVRKVYGSPSREDPDDVFDDLPPLEDDFDEDRDVWERREILTRHRDWAKARQASPQAVLGFSLARSAAAVPPAYILPPTIMGHASLNLFVAISSDSGGGKSGALQVSKQALKIATPEPEPYVQQPLGSGEGLMQNFVRHEKESFKDEDGKTKTTKRVVQHTERVLSVVDEIGHLIGMTQRSGQTLTSTLRSAWSGAGLGFGYSKDDNRLEVPEHRYRQCVAAGVQTKAAGGLLSEEEEALGTPQRFVWLRAVDDRGIIDVDSIPDPPERIVWNAPAGSITGSFGRSDEDQPEGLKPPDEDPTGWHVFTICETAKRKIREDHAISNNPEGAALVFSPERIEAAASGIERHLNLSRLKIAAILRLWEDPQDLHINEDDWELAGNIIKLSQRELGRIQAELRKLAEKQDWARGSRAGRQEVAKQEILDDEDQKRQARAAQAVLNKLKALDGEWISASALRRAVRKNHREFLPDALEDLVNTGQAEPQEIEYNGQTGTRYRYVGAG